MKLTFSLKFLEEIIFKVLQGPIDFIDIILFNLSSEYRQEVHNLMNSIQNLANNTNNSFIETLQNTINELQERVTNLERKNRNSKCKLNKCNKEAKYRNTILNELKGKFHSDEMIALEKRLQT